MYRKALLALLVLVGVVAGPAAAAQAHPFGDPQTVTIAADPARPHVVRVKWKVGGLDDLTLLGVKIGVLPEDRVFLDGAVFYQDSDEAAIAPSGQLADYLLSRITVAEGDDRCVGTVEPPTALAKAGATVDFVCPRPVGKVAVAVRTLLDLHPAYRTLASGPGGQRAVYQDDAATHEWRLSGTAAPSSRLRAGTTAAGIAVAVAVVAATAAFLFRRRRNSTKHLS